MRADSAHSGNAMKFYQNLYVGESIKNPAKIRKKLKRYAKMNNVWLIAYAEENRQLEIYHCIMLQQYYYKAHPPCVVGIAASYEEASQLVCRIAQEAVQQTGRADLAGYLFADAAGNR